MLPPAGQIKKKRHLLFFLLSSGLRHGGHDHSWEGVVTEASLHSITKLPLNKHPQLIKYLISNPAEAMENNLHIVNLPGHSRIAARLGESGGGTPLLTGGGGYAALSSP